MTHERNTIRTLEDGTSETTTAPGPTSIGQRIYLDRDQCEFLGASYTSKSEDLVCSAEAILRSKAQGYDSYHIDLLTPMGGATIVAKPTGHGWFEITRVVKPANRGQE